MPRRMSCSMTVDAVKARTKTVTRRHVDTWANLKAGDRLTLIEKGMGLRKGERQVVLAEVEVVSSAPEYLDELYCWNRDGGTHEATQYGLDEMIAEGLPDMHPFQFAKWWAFNHGYRDEWEAGCDGGTMCRRIEWRYLDWCHVCPNCRASFSLPLGMTCADHRPELVLR